MTAPDSTSLVSRVLVGVASAALATMTLWTLVDVITRQLLSSPLKGTIDLVEATLVLVVFLALPAVLERDEQVTVDVLDHMIGARWVAWIKRLASLLMFVFLAVLGYAGLTPLADAWRFGDHKPDLPIPIHALLAAIEVAIAISLVVVAVRFVRELRGAFARRDAR